MIGTSIGNSLIWDNGTNVGIGNTNTSYTLDVSGTGRFTSTLLVSGAATFDSYVTISGGNNLYLTNTKLGGDASYNFDINYNTGGTPSLTWYGGSTTSKFKVTSTGNVGIGTSSPSFQLSIGKTTDTTITALGIQNNVNNVSRLYFTAYTNEATSYTYLDADGRSTGYMAFRTNDTERMRITSGGNVLINNTTLTANLSVADSAKTATGVPLLLSSTDSANQMQLSFTRSTNNNYAIQSIEQGIAYRILYLNPNGGAVYAGAVRLDTLSDLRVKDNIEPISNALNKVLSITGKKFHLKDEEEGKLRYGFIAQELEGILDEFVIQTDNTFKKDDLIVENVKSVENWASSWAALLVEAIKEQQATITSLQDRIYKLENK